jgi:hypothetical protein
MKSWQGDWTSVCLMENIKELCITFGWGVGAQGDSAR